MERDMKIGNQTFSTPSDDPLGYPLDWRWQVANAAAALGQTITSGRMPDQDTRTLSRHLQRRKEQPLRDTEKPTPFDRVLAWHDSPAAVLIQAFLLAAESFEAAASELGLPAEDVRLYGRLFYDVRDDDGQRRPGVMMRLQAEFEALGDADMAAGLKKVALGGGIHGLRQLLHAGVLKPRKTEPSLDEMVESELKRRLHARELRTGDLVRLQSNAIQRERLAEDKKNDGKPELTQSNELVRHILGLTAPQMVRPPERTQEALQAGTDKIQARLKSQRNINAIPLQDSDDGAARLNDMLRAQFGVREA
jgi:hypothetical protein